MNKLINKIILLWIKTLQIFRYLLEMSIPKINCKKILEKNFKKDNSFSFVQVGANDGVSFDYLYEIVTNRKSKGIVIEPIKEYYDELVKNYESFIEIIKVNKAVHPIEKEMIIYKVKEESYVKYPEWVKGIASLNPKHYENLDINKDDIIELSVECNHLMDIIKNNYKCETLDYFQVDTEGFDFEVIKMMDFKVIKPKIIKFENVSLKREEIKQLKEMLMNIGYFLFDEGTDTIAVDLSKIRLL